METAKPRQDHAVVNDVVRQLVQKTVRAAEDEATVHSLVDELTTKAVCEVGEEPAIQAVVNELVRATVCSAAAGELPEDCALPPLSRNCPPPCGGMSIADFLSTECWVEIDDSALFDEPDAGACTSANLANGLDGHRATPSFPSKSEPTKKDTSLSALQQAVFGAVRNESKAVGRTLASTWTKKIRREIGQQVVHSWKADPSKHPADIAKELGEGVTVQFVRQTLTQRGLWKKEHHSERHWSNERRSTSPTTSGVARRSRRIHVKRSTPFSRASQELDSNMTSTEQESNDADVSELKHPAESSRKRSANSRALDMRRTPSRGEVEEMIVLIHEDDPAKKASDIAKELGGGVTTQLVVSILTRKGLWNKGEQSEANSVARDSPLAEASRVGSCGGSPSSPSGSGHTGRSAENEASATGKEPEPNRFVYRESSPECDVSERIENVEGSCLMDESLLKEVANFVPKAPTTNQRGVGAGRKAEKHKSLRKSGKSKPPSFSVWLKRTPKKRSRTKFYQQPHVSPTTFTGYDDQPSTSATPSTEDGWMEWEDAGDVKVNQMMQQPASSSELRSQPFGEASYVAPVANAIPLPDAVDSSGSRVIFHEGFVYIAGPLLTDGATRVYQCWFKSCPALAQFRDGEYQFVQQVFNHTHEKPRPMGHHGWHFGWDFPLSLADLDAARCVYAAARKELEKRIVAMRRAHPTAPNIHIARYVGHGVTGHIVKTVLSRPELRKKRVSDVSRESSDVSGKVMQILHAASPPSNNSSVAAVATASDATRSPGFSTSISASAPVVPPRMSDTVMETPHLTEPAQVEGSRTMMRTPRGIVVLPRSGPSEAPCSSAALLRRRKRVPNQLDLLYPDVVMPTFTVALGQWDHDYYLSPHNPADFIPKANIPSSKVQQKNSNAPKLAAQKSPEVLNRAMQLRQSARPPNSACSAPVTDAPSARLRQPNYSYLAPQSGLPQPDATIQFQTPRPPPPPGWTVAPPSSTWTPSRPSSQYVTSQGRFVYDPAERTYRHLWLGAVRLLQGRSANDSKKPDQARKEHSCPRLQGAAPSVKQEVSDEFALVGELLRQQSETSAPDRCSSNDSSMGTTPLLTDAPRSQSPAPKKRKRVTVAVVDVQTTSQCSAETTSTVLLDSSKKATTVAAPSSTLIPCTSPQCSSDDIPTALPSSSRQINVAAASSQERAPRRISEEPLAADQPSPANDEQQVVASVVADLVKGCSSVENSEGAEPQRCVDELDRLADADDCSEPVVDEEECVLLDSRTGGKLSEEAVVRFIMMSIVHLNEPLESLNKAKIRRKGPSWMSVVDDDQITAALERFRSST